MKKIIALLLVLSVVLMGFIALAEEETNPSTGSSTEEGPTGGSTGSSTEESSSGGSGDTNTSGGNISGETGDKDGGSDSDWSSEEPTDDTKKEEDSGSSSSSGRKTTTRKDSQTSNSSSEDASTNEDDNLLRRGSRGDRVRQLQEKLIGLGYYEGSVDGSFGPMTEEAVLKYQKEYGIEQTGTLDEEQLLVLLKIEKPVEEIEAEAIEVPAAIEVVDTETAMVNILKNTGVPQMGETSNYEEGIWRDASGGTGAREVVDIEDAPINGIIKGFRITDDGSSEHASDVAIDAVPTEYQHIYILSCYAKGEGKIRLQVGRSPYPTVLFDATDEWAQYSFAFFVDEKIGSTMESPVTNVYVGIVGGVASDVIFCGMQLEEVQAHAWVRSGD